jgi:hypothetical protein
LGLAFHRTILYLTGLWRRSSVIQGASGQQFIA